MGFEYIRTHIGMAQIAIEVCNLIAFICVACAPLLTTKADAFLVASIGGFIITGILFIFHLLNIVAKIPLPWNKIELCFCVLWAIFYLITSVFIIDQQLDEYIAGGVFGLFATVIYVFHAYASYRGAD